MYFTPETKAVLNKFIKELELTSRNLTNEVIQLKEDYTKERVSISEKVHGKVDADWQIKDIDQVFNNNQYPFRTFRTLFNDTVIQGIAAHEYLKINYNAKIKVGSRGSHNLKEYLACHCFIIPTSYKYENNQSVYTLLISRWGLIQHVLW